MAEPPASIGLTFAELEYLTANSGNHATLRRQLYLPDYDDHHAVADSGLASLQIRRLARVKSDTVELVDELSVITSLLDACTDWLDLIYIHDAAPASMFVGSAPSSGQAGLLIGAESPGCYRCYVLEPSVAPPARVVSVVDTMLAAEGANAMYVQRRDDEVTRLVVACTSASEWSYARDDQQQLLETTREGARNLVEIAVTELVAS